MFETYKTNETGMREIHMVKQRITDAVEDVLQLLPKDSRDTNIFKTHIETAVFYGVRAVASKSTNHTHRTEYTKAGAVTKENANVTN